MFTLERDELKELGENEYYDENSYNSLPFLKSGETADWQMLAFPLYLALTNVSGKTKQGPKQTLRRANQVGEGAQS